MEDRHFESIQVSVVVPCFNEGGAVESTVRGLVDCLGDVDSYELIFVDDGSMDETGSKLEMLAQEYPALRVIRHPRNRGYGAALKSGIRQARGELIAITDADGTYPNERLPELIEQCRTGDMVVGSRTAEGVKYSKIRKIPKMFLRRYVSWLANQNIPDMNSGMRVFRREIALKYLSLFPDGFSFTTTITLVMIRNSYLVQFVPITYAKRVGNSKIQPIRDTLRFTQLITRTGMYFAPMRLLGPVALVVGLAFLVSFGIDLYNRDLTESTLLLLLFTMNTGMFALLADMIDKRSVS
jgi:glycosyltransferase involved in cell wall biosynthesis